MDDRLLLSAKGVNKSFGPTRALIDVDVEIRRGEIRGLIGENGSGKSTFSSIIAGAQKEDSGTFLLNGQPYHPKNMVDAQHQGVSMIIQEMGTIGGITVASNIFAGRLEEFRKFGLLNWKQINSEADKILEKIGAPEIKSTMMIDQLNFEDRKIVEIARALSTKPELLIIDETTTALATKGRRLIYNVIQKLHEQDKAVLFISHDLDELMEVCNTITVLRDGVIIDTLDKDHMSIELMRKLMVGRDLVGSYYRPDFDGSSSSEVVLEAKQISLRPFFRNVDLKLHKGEILGLGGLSDCGMHEIGKVLYGIETPVTGKVTLADGTEIHDSVQAVRHHMAYVSKDRDKESVILSASIQSNIVLPSLRTMKKKITGFISRKSESALADEQIKVMSIKCRNGKQLVKELSGGNKQKVVFSKWLGTDSEIFILDCPTRGIDVGVKADMYKLMMELKHQGKSIIMISEELLELIGMSDRIMLFKDGVFTKELMRSETLSEKDVIDYII